MEKKKRQELHEKSLLLMNKILAACLSSSSPSFSFISIPFSSSSCPTSLFTPAQALVFLTLESAHYEQIETLGNIVSLQFFVNSKL